MALPTGQGQLSCWHKDMTECPYLTDWSRNQMLLSEASNNDRRFSSQRRLKTCSRHDFVLSAGCEIKYSKVLEWKTHHFLVC